MSYSFNGTSDYLQAASNAAYNIASFGDVTVAMWIKRGNTGVTSIPLIQPTNNYGILIFSDDKLYNQSGGGGSTVTIADTTTWHHVAITMSVATQHLYIDGVDVTGTGGPHALGGQDVIKVGTDGVNFFNGKIAYVAIWNTALSAGNITTLQTSSTPESVGSGCIASWHLATNADFTDHSGTANNIAVGSGTTFSSDNPTLGGGGGTVAFVVGGLLGQ